MINALTVRTGGDPTAVEDVIVGSVSTAVGFRASVAAQNRASAVEGMTIWRDVSRAAEARAAMTVNANNAVIQEYDKAARKLPSVQLTKGIRISSKLQDYLFPIALAWRREPSRSDFRALGEGDCVVDIDAQVAHGILDIGVAQ